MRDIDIRRRLRADERLHPWDSNTRIVEELGLCQGVARVDLAVVNGTIHGYEIKSERDTLTRLSGQAEIYNHIIRLRYGCDRTHARSKRLQSGSEVVGNLDCCER